MSISGRVATVRIFLDQFMIADSAMELHATRLMVYECPCRHSSVGFQVLPNGIELGMVGFAKPCPRVGRCARFVGT